MTQPPKAASTRGRGRPPRLSREKIVDAAVALVYEDPRTPLTIKRVAEAADSAPMALYRYFPDRDDLLHAVADRVSSDMRFDEPTGATWQERLRGWMLLSMEYLRPYPQLLPYIASTRQPSWLPSFALLTEMLRPLELGDEDLAMAITLIGTTIVGQATLAATRVPAVEMSAVLREALGEADAEERARVGPVIDALPGAFDRLYDVVIDITITAVESLAGDTSTTGPAAKRVRRAPTNPLFSSAS
ncbi:TetR/AcrR family transcriptional regulator [Embleya hyalina]|uniref:TetR family transcriptional regulator n=1 Tax=Embleya hyalina TaxID=516124 RepID=A0A401YMZ3_9ACTN|nr:TetR/AcrR family transcriptional regulator [Embleya hyalina]GCD95937.1 TetR family transcriptional regulator [Embleya hyalina]